MTISLPNPFTLSSKTALVTGAGGLLGPQHAYALLESGASVVLTDISSDSLHKTHSFLEQYFDATQIHSYLLDVSDESSVISLHQELESKGIYVNILINNAAINPVVTSSASSLLPSSRLENFTLDNWNRELGVGLTGAFICSKIFASSMYARFRSGVVINICSDLSIISPDQRLYSNTAQPFELRPVKPVTYSVVKSALHGLTLYLSTYWPNGAIRCNSLSPGGVFVDQSPEFVQNISYRIPMARMARSDEYRCAIQFLASDASSYMTGQNLVIDGGRTIW